VKVNFTFFKLFLVFVSLISACTNRDKPLKNLNDIRASSGSKERIVKNPISKDTLLPYLNTYNQDSVGLEVISLSIIEEQHFINRFQPISSCFFALEMKDSTQKLTHFAWTFKDSIDTKNAFYNWLDIEKSSKILASKSLSSDFFTAIVSETNIDFFYSKKKMDVQKLIRYVKLNRNTAIFNFIIIQKRNSKVFWYKFTNEKLTLIS